MEVKFKAFKKELNQRGLVSGDASYHLKLHELVIDKDNLHKLIDWTTDKEATIVVKYD